VLNLRIHRGAHEVGGNCIELQVEGQSLLLDLGMPLTGEKPEDVPLPNVPGLASGSNELLGILLSHPHADHYGLISKASPNVPVYLGKDAYALLNAALPFTGFGLRIQHPIFYRDREPFHIGPFLITPFLNDHSAFDSYSFLIEAKGKSLFYSGDFRGHGRKRSLYYQLLREQSIKGVDILLLEGTHLGRGDASAAQLEVDLEEALTRSIKATPGLVLACFSPMNIDRFVSFCNASRRSGRTFVIDVYAAYLLDALNRPSLPRPSVFLPAVMKKKLKREKNEAVVNPFRRRRIYPEQTGAKVDKLVMLFRPSMIKEFEGLGCLAEGKLIYSQWPGYLKTDRVNLADWCKKQKMDFEILHTSGHADLPTLTRFAKAIAAKRIIPIHSFAPELLCELASNVTLAKDGEWLVI
jgi:ribonuclease J